MSITIDFSPADLQLLQEQAAAGNVSIEEFIRNSSMKSARNAEYLAKIDQSIRRLNEGKGTKLTWEQLEKLANGQDFR